MHSTKPKTLASCVSSPKVANAVGALLPEGAIVSDEANTAGLWVAAATAGAPPHDALTLTGGAIGQGLPVATGAAVACPDRKVVCLEADGSAMYTIQALWTQAREQLPVTTIIFANNSYAILKAEFANMKAGDAPGPRALSMIDLTNPTLDWQAMAKSMGVPSVAVETAEDFHAQLLRSFDAEGPMLIEVRL